jgi:hypothetical protein
MILPAPAPTQPLKAPVRPPVSKRPFPTPPAVERLRQDVLSRRAPKQRCITLAVQPLACYFCRGRKIACGPPADLSSGNQICEYVVAHKNILSLHFFLYRNPLYLSLRTIITIYFIVSCGCAWLPSPISSSVCVYVRMLTGFFFFPLVFPFWYGQAMCATEPGLRISCGIRSWAPCIWTKSGICEAAAALNGNFHLDVSVPQLKWVATY